MEKKTFASGFITYSYKGTVEQKGNLIELSIPNVIGTLIPAGRRKVTIPINQLASVGTEIFIDAENIAGALILAAPLFMMLFGFAIGGESDVSSLLFFLVLFGFTSVIEFINSFQVNLKITTTSGEIISKSSNGITNEKHFGIFIPMKDKAIAEDIANELNILINERLDDTNVRIHTDRTIEAHDRNTDRIIDAINKK